jgi:uncharacterized Zn-finger protein
MAKLEPFEVVATDHAEVACDGGKGALGHPRVFLHINRDSLSVTCPYCSRMFVYQEASGKRAAH